MTAVEVHTLLPSLAARFSIEEFVAFCTALGYDVTVAAPEPPP